jgi:signal transduction histidine kinase
VPFGNQNARLGVHTVRTWSKPVGPLKSQYRLIAEVSHQINSPLAAIRNALYLAIKRTTDSEVQRYLLLADEEVSAIASRIRRIRDHIEDGQSPISDKSDAQSMVQKMGKAA